MGEEVRERWETVWESTGHSVGSPHNVLTRVCLHRCGACADFTLKPAAQWCARVVRETPPPVGGLWSARRRSRGRRSWYSTRAGA